MPQQRRVSAEARKRRLEEINRQAANRPAPWHEGATPAERESTLRHMERDQVEREERADREQARELDEAKETLRRMGGIG